TSGNGEPCGFLTVGKNAQTRQGKFKQAGGNCMKYLKAMLPLILAVGLAAMTPSSANADFRLNIGSGGVWVGHDHSYCNDYGNNYYGGYVSPYYGSYYVNPTWDDDYRFRWHRHHAYVRPYVSTWGGWY